MKTKGVIRYKPDWRVVLDVDDEIPALYRWFVLRRHGIRLLGSRWQAHVTVVRKEEPPVKEHWLKYEGRELEIEYSVTVHRYLDTVFWHLDVTSPELLDLREELGLPRQPEDPLHITVGRESTEEKSRLLWIG